LFSKKTFTSELGILIDFGIIVSQNIITSFPKGIINSHFSLLPDLRGPDPITYSILKGKKESGVSLMLLDKKMDTGDLLTQDRLPLHLTETSVSLTNRLIELSDSLLKDTLPKYINGTIHPVTQKEWCSNAGLDFNPTYTKKAFKQDGVIDWTEPATNIERQIRAYQDWPKSRTSLNGIDCIIVSAQVVKERRKPKELFVKNNRLAIGCGKDSLIIHKIKPSGKKEMDSSSFLMGYKSRILN
jgi:methionyl-tRNA formyltransferase